MNKYQIPQVLIENIRAYYAKSFGHFRNVGKECYEGHTWDGQKSNHSLYK